MCNNRLTVVKTLAMPTCDRVEFAARSLRTFIENSLRFGLECDYVIYDDSLSPQTRNGYRTMLKALRKEFGVSLCYAGFEEKISFLKQLLTGSEIPPEIAKYSLFDMHKHRDSTPGANRNAVLLDNPGRALVSVDDDTFCHVSRLSDATNDVEAVPGDIYSVSDPCEFVSFTDRKQLLESLCYTDTPFLQIHDNVLGKTFGELAGEQLGATLGEGKVLLSFNGLAGDCAWAPLTSFFYFLVTGPSLLRLTSSAAVYEAARSSREILRVSRRIFVTPISASPSAFVGMDNRELLPPFMPLGRTEDNFYWEMKRKCFPNDLFAHLPWALLHEPPRGRHFHPADMRRPRQGFDFHSIVMAFLRSLPKMFHPRISDRLAAMGKEFVSFGNLDVREFEMTVKDLLRRDVKGIKDCLEKKLEENTDGCKLWREDMEVFLEGSWSLLDGPDVAVPVEFSCFQGRTEALELAKKLISAYGQLLLIWPHMIEKAAKLRNSENRLAKPIS